MASLKKVEVNKLSMMSRLPTNLFMQIKLFALSHSSPCHTPVELLTAIQSLSGGFSHCVNCQLLPKIVAKYSHKSLFAEHFCIFVFLTLNNSNFSCKSCKKGFKITIASKYNSSTFFILSIGKKREKLCDWKCIMVEIRLLSFNDILTFVYLAYLSDFFFQ